MTGNEIINTIHEMAMCNETIDVIIISLQKFDYKGKGRDEKIKQIKDQIKKSKIKSKEFFDKIQQEGGLKIDEMS